MVIAVVLFIIFSPNTCKRLIFNNFTQNGEVCPMRGNVLMVSLFCFVLLLPPFIIANEAADPRGSAVELANHRAVREYRRKISSQRKGLFLTIFGCK